MEFKRNLRQIRIDSGKTQKDIATALCVSETCYAHWEQGRSEPSIANLKKLCEIFDIKVGELLGFEDEFGNKIK
ncbi:MAG: helix-turn-helix transcriptional regulator [Clostridia bacterium]|nr:helix-turn-helix transcriptional regulator [Clostridia bacterium]